MWLCDNSPIHLFPSRIIQFQYSRRIRKWANHAFPASLWEFIEGPRRRSFQHMWIAITIDLYVCNLLFVLLTYSSSLLRSRLVVRVLRFLGEKCAKTGFKLWPNCDKSKFTQKLTPYPWIFTFYCIFINKYFWNFEKWKIFFQKVEKKTFKVNQGRQSGKNGILWQKGEKG